MENADDESVMLNLIVVVINIVVGILVWNNTILVALNFFSAGMNAVFIIKRLL